MCIHKLHMPFTYIHTYTTCPHTHRCLHTAHICIRTMFTPHIHTTHVCTCVCACRSHMYMCTMNTMHTYHTGIRTYHVHATHPCHTYVYASYRHAHRGQHITYTSSCRHRAFSVTVLPPEWAALVLPNQRRLFPSKASRNVVSVPFLKIKPRAPGWLSQLSV